MRAACMLPFCLPALLGPAGPGTAQAGPADASLRAASVILERSMWRLLRARAGEAARPNDELAAALAPALDAPDPRIRARALTVAGRTRDPAWGPELRRALSAEEAEVRRRALFALADLGDPRSLVLLETRVQQGGAHPEDRPFAELALGLAAPDGRADSTLGARIQAILARDLTAHLDELLACTAAFSAQGGRAALVHLLEHGLGSLQRDRSAAAARLRALALYTLGSRVAGEADFVRLRALGLRNDRRGGLERFAAWLGFAAHPRLTKGGLSRSAAKAAAAELRNRRAGCAGLALEALARFAPARALSEARRRLRLSRVAVDVGAAALAVLAEEGGARDRDLVLGLRFAKRRGPERAQLEAARRLALVRLLARHPPAGAAAADLAARLAETWSEDLGAPGIRAPLGLATAVALAALGAPTPHPERVPPLSAVGPDPAHRRLLAWARTRLLARETPVDLETLALAGRPEALAKLLPLLARLKDLKRRPAPVPPVLLRALEQAAWALSGPVRSYARRLGRRFGPNPPPLFEDLLRW